MNHKEHVQPLLAESFFDLSPDLLSVHDPRGRFMQINSAYEQFLGYQAQDLMGQSFETIVHPDDRHQVHTVITQLAIHETVKDIKLRCRDSSGGLHWFEVSARQAEQGLIYVVSRNITDRIELEAQSQRHMDILERSIDASINGVLIVDAQAEDQPIIFANSAIERITGYTPEEAIGRNCRFLQGERTNPETRKALREAIVQGHETHVVIENYRKDGTLFWNELYLSPVRNESGDITHFIGIQNDISSLQETRQLLTYTTHHDALTGLPNRQLFTDRVAQALSQIRQPGQVLAILLIDVSNYRPLQDQFGPAVMQEALLHMVNRLRAVLEGSTGTLGRLDPDRFAVLIPEHTKLGIDELHGSLRNCFAGNVKAGGEHLRVNARFGLVYASRYDSDPADMLRRAQVALSHQGIPSDQDRAPLSVYHFGMEQSLHQQAQLRRRLRCALAERSFTLAYQPLIHARSGRVIGAEVLMRWHDSELGSVSPAEFIPAAEAEGLIDPMTDQLIDKLVAQTHTLLSPFCGKLQFNINISPLSLNAGFPERLQSGLAKSLLPPSSIELELTESALLNLDEELSSTLNRLRRLGFSIAIDDFGTGFTGLSYLKNLPVDTLKIDRSFIQDVVRDGRDSSIVDSIVHLAQNLRIKLVAEGVEHASQVVHLTNAGIDAFQGYYFARPMSAEQLVVSLAEHNPRPGYVYLPAPEHNESP